MMEDRYVYNSVTVAKYIVAYANAHNFGINMTKLQKLLYITYGVYMAVKNERLLNEHPQAWPYGPVFPTTRNKLLKLEFTSISLHSKDLDKIRSDNEMQSLVRLVFNSYGKMSAASLSEWSHKEGSPWDKTVKQPSFQWGCRIPDNYIQDYFKTLISHKDGEGEN